MRNGDRKGGHPRSLSFALLLIGLLLGFCTGVWAEPYEVVIETILREEQLRDLSLVEEALSQITLPLLDCTVRLQSVSIQDHEHLMELVVAQNQQLDIVNVGRTTPLAQMVAGGRLLPLEELLSSYGQGAGEKLERVLENGMVDGKLYMLPECPYDVSKTGFVYNQRMAQELGLDIKPVMSREEIEEVGEILSREGIYLLSQGTGGNDLILFGLFYPELRALDVSNFSRGVFREGEEELLNVFDLPELCEFYEKLRSYVKKGWIPADTLESGLTSIDYFRRQESFMVWMDAGPISLDAQQKNYSFPLGGFFTSPQTSLILGEQKQPGFGISPTSRRPELAMGVLNLVYTLPEVANLLMYGIEGLDYVVLGENIIGYPPGVDATNVGYCHRFTSFGDALEIYQWAPGDPLLRERVETLQEQVVHDPLWGYAFDPRPVAEKVQAVDSILAEYLPPLECGLVEEVEEAIQEVKWMTERAGIQEILQENQRQQRAWLSRRKEG